jgi:hypothetical protein
MYLFLAQMMVNGLRWLYLLSNWYGSQDMGHVVLLVYFKVVLSFFTTYRASLSVNIALSLFEESLGYFILD